MEDMLVYQSNPMFGLCYIIRPQKSRPVKVKLHISFFYLISRKDQKAALVLVQLYLTFSKI